MTRAFSLKGVIVLSVGCFTHADTLGTTPEQKRGLDELHLRKIDLADSVFVVDPGGYVGESTQNEITYAMRMNKRVTYMEPRASGDRCEVPTAATDIPF